MPKRSVSAIFYCVTLFLLIYTIFSAPVVVHAGPPALNLGGRVLMWFPICFGGLHTYILHNGAITTPIFYLWGVSAQKAYGPPSHVGVLTMGEAFLPVPCLFYCGISVCLYAYGFLALPNFGSSLQ